MKNLKAEILIFLIFILGLSISSCIGNKLKDNSQKLEKDTNKNNEDKFLIEHSNSKNPESSYLSNNLDTENTKEERNNNTLIWLSKDSLLRLVYYVGIPKCGSIPYIFYYNGKKILTLDEHNFFKQIGDQVDIYCTPYINYPPERIANGVYAIIGESMGNGGHLLRNIWIIKCNKRQGQIVTTLVISGGCNAMHLIADTLHKKVIAQVKMQKGFKASDPVAEKNKAQYEDYVESYYSCRINGKEVTGKLIPKRDSFNYYSEFDKGQFCETWELDLFY